MSVSLAVSGAPDAPADLLSPKLAFRLALLVFAVLGAYVLLTFDQHGISNDEEVQHVYGRLLLDFYASGFADRSAFAYKNLYLYGGLFDLIAAGLERLVPMNVWDLRHLLSAGFGLLGLVGTWMLARLLMGETAGLVALVLLSLTGAWSGAMFTHTKDVPFATTMVWALYFTARFASRLPTVKASDLVGLGIAIGCAFGLRVGAVFAVFYLGVAVLAASWLNGEDLRARIGVLRRAVLALLPAAALALVLMGVFWPWAMLSPGNLVRAMTTFSHFSFQLHTILDGVVMKNGEVPGYYLSEYLLVRLPELFLLGVSCAVLGGLHCACRIGRSRERLREAQRWLPLALACCVPLAYTLIMAPPLYNGIRHFTFLLPPLAVAAAAGLVHVLEVSARWGRARVAAVAAFVLLGAWHAVTLAQLHPYEYVYDNSFAGGPAGEPDDWELDYWGDSLREAVEQLNGYVAREGGARRPYTVAVCAEPLQAQEWLDPGLTVTNDWRAADFFLSPTQMDCDRVLKGWIVGSVERDGVTLAVVRDRRMLRGIEREPRRPR